MTNQRTANLEAISDLPVYDRLPIPDSGHDHAKIHEFARITLSPVLQASPPYRDQLSGGVIGRSMDSQVIYFAPRTMEMVDGSILAHPDGIREIETSEITRYEIFDDGKRAIKGWMVGR